MKYIMSLVTILLFAINASGQSLTGKIIDNHKNPVSEAHILNISNGKHTHSDENGNFILEVVKTWDTLNISHIGYSMKKIVVSSTNSTVLITLEAKSFSLDEVVISPEVNALNLITHIDIQTNPVNSSQDILRQVPGMVIGQHAGGGKAEQIFLRGFDIDHGTDIQITADGLPVNLVSHAHGQGYADLHFLIPETIENIDFGKGPYYAGKGNFNTSGYVNFNTKHSLENSLLKFEKGQFNTNRVLGMFGIENKDQNKSYIATEYISTDGPFESPQNFNRINLFGKYSGNISPSDKIGITATYFTSKWDASGQIPQRAVDNGKITRFGAIDDTEGGNTGRINLLMTYDKFIDGNSFIVNRIFYSAYNFELYSNFTFFLNDTVNGDQIRQKEQRAIYGMNSEYNRVFSYGNYHGTLQAGISLRNDLSKNDELSHTVNRIVTLEQKKLGTVDETNIAAYFNINFDFNKWTVNPSLRYDYFDFQYNDNLNNEYETQTSVKAVLSPKLNILYNFSQSLQFYLKSGKGFHSNDTRVVVARNGEKILPAAYGFDFGVLWKPVPRLLVNTAYWYLFLEQEFVYVGDEAVVEPSGKTQRQGFDFSLRYQALEWLFWNFDTNYSHARATEEPQGENYIPLAPDFTISTGLNFIYKSDFYSGLNIRHISDRPANEDNSIIAKGYTVADFNVGHSWKKIDLGIQIQNLFNTEWNETQFATESRLMNEPAPVEEIHFIPGTPFYIKGTISYKF